MYAVIRTGGKQYRVSEGSRIDVERIPGNPGERVEFDDVILVVKDGDLVFGDRLLGAKVVAEIKAQGLGPKVTIFKFKRRKGYRRKIGHRQPYTSLLIKEIYA